MAKKYKVWISISVGNGQYEKDECIIEGDEQDCEDAIWDMLNTVHVETGWEEVEETE